MNIKVKKNNYLSIVFTTYIACFILRLIEYFIIQTDRSILGEAFIHKILGIVLLFMLVKKLNFDNIGFKDNNKVINLLKGFGIGIISFLCAYLIEIFVFVRQSNYLGFEFYVSSYSPNGNFGKQVALLFFIICILGNIINVIMEESIFRGLFQKLLEKRYSFLISAIISSVLFGIWHIVSPFRLLIEGQIAFKSFAISGIFLVLTSALVGFNFALMTKLSGGLYVAMASHFVNNTIVNILHITSSIGTDEFLSARVGIAQTISFVIVLIWYFRKKRI